MGQKVKNIKRYQNRKLYDTSTSRYVTLDDIAEMIQKGEDVTVVDNRTNKDITSSTLTQIIFETERKSKAVLPIQVLKDIIRGNGGSLTTFFQKTLKTGVREIVHVKDEIQRKIESVTGVSQLHEQISDLQGQVIELKNKLSKYEAGDKK